MSDIKKKIMDILFEEPEQNNSLESQVLEDIKLEGDLYKAPKASDILYGKQEKPSSFIDYFEVPRSNKKDEDDTKIECYELRENVSPIFGVVNQKGKKKKLIDKDMSKAINNTGDSNRKHNDYTNIVISPIYGYDDDKANGVRQAFKDIGESTRVMSDEEIEEKYNEEPAFELVDDETKEVVNESVLEAVEELNQGSYVVEQLEKENEVFEEEDKQEEEIEELDDKEEDDIYYADPQYPLEEEHITQELSKEDIEEAFRKINASNYTSGVFNNSPKNKYDINDDSNDGEDLFDELMKDDD